MPQLVSVGNDCARETPEPKIEPADDEATIVEMECGTIPRERVASQDLPLDLDDTNVLDNLWRSYQTEENYLVLEPNDRSARRRCADFLCRWMRISTNGNTVTIDGPGDTPAFKIIWAKHAPRAVSLYRELLRYEDEAQDPELLCDFIECYSSLSGAKGIALAALTGDAVVFLSNVGKLQEKAPAVNAGLAQIYYAAFYLAAPFPVRSPQRALVAAQASLEIAPKSRRNLYYAGLAALASGEKPMAESYFAAALEADATATSQSEIDIAVTLTRESLRGLEAARAA